MKRFGVIQMTQFKYFTYLLFEHSGVKDTNVQNVTYHTCRCVKTNLPFLDTRRLRN